MAFNHGEYDPSSAEGQHLLAHELAHVRQQAGAAVSMLPQEGALEIDPDPRLEQEAEETADRVMRGGELGIFRMQHSEVHVQRKDWNAGPSNAERLAIDSPGAIEKKVDELTTKTYRLTKPQLRDLVTKVDSPSEVGDYIKENGIKAASSLQDSMSSGFSGAVKGWKGGSAVGSFAGPVGTVSGGLLGMPVGYFLATKIGDGIADEIQNHLRDLLGLNTDQEFKQGDKSDSEDESGFMGVF
ncbi:eCIS core domain-containing protein [Haloferax larsenii]